MRITYLAAAVVALAFSGTAQAATLNINFASNPTGTVSYTPGSGGLQGATALNFGSTTWYVPLFNGIGAGDQSGLAPGNTLKLETSGLSSILTFGSGNSASVDWTKSWSAGGHDFLETFTSATIDRNASDAITLNLKGTLAEDGSFLQNAYLIVSANQAGGNGIISVTATNSSVALGAPGPVPGVGLAGLAALALAGLYTRARRA